MSDINKPNLFYWATSELSQDAFICWLLAWSNYKDTKESLLNKASTHFLSQLTQNKISSFQKIEICKQYKGIDILVKINDEYALLIEDKTHTQDHSGQLERYYQILLEEFDKNKIFPVYIKTGDQSDYKAVLNAGYKLFLRTDFIDVLDYALKIGVENNILVDFHNHLKILEQSFQSYRTLRVSQWHWDSWKGFYTELAQQLGDGKWSYVPQKNGGFLGFSWRRNYKTYNGNGFAYYLQLEHHKFCFKIEPDERVKAEEVRHDYRSLLYPKAKEYNILISQNGRVGNTMTVAILNEPYIQTDEQGYIDFGKTIKLLKSIETMLSEI